jgi:hypothetical protein
MKYTFYSKSGTHHITVTKTPCNGDASYINYRFVCDGMTGGGGVAKDNKEIEKELVKWAKHMFVGFDAMFLDA